MIRIAEATVEKSEMTLSIRFTDGVQRILDLRGKLSGPMFEPLRDPAFFAQVRVDEFGVLTWPNGADLAPEFVLWETRRDDPGLREAFLAWGYMKLDLHEWNED